MPAFCGAEEYGNGRAQSSAFNSSSAASIPRAGHAGVDTLKYAGVKRLGPAAIVLLLAVAVSFVPAMRAGYTNWDDRAYYGAARQQLPLLLTAIVTGHYHPLTMLSLGLDVRLFGTNATEMHVVNVALHAVTALLILLLLEQLTGS